MQEQIVLHAPGALPGIPGEHAAGVYLVDYEARTIIPYVPNGATLSLTYPPHPSGESGTVVFSGIDHTTGESVTETVTLPQDGSTVYSTHQYSALTQPVEAPLIDLSALGG